MKRLFALMLGVALLLCACAEDNVYKPDGSGLIGEEITEPPQDTTVKEQSLSLVYDEEKTLNPYTCASYTNRMLFGLLYQSLFTTDASYAVEPQLCKSYSVSKDLKTYVFYLENATFADGTVLSVSDVLASLEAARSGSIYASRFANVESIGLSADGGVRVQLSTAYENLPLLLDIPIVRAATVRSPYPEGTGPYALESSAAGRTLRLRENWWCEADLPVYAQSIPLISAQTATEIRDAFEREGVGVVCANPAADSYVDFRSDYELWDCENGVFLYLGCRAKSSVFGNEYVRRALTHAIDRQTLVQTVYRSFGMAASLPASPNFPYYSKALAAKYAYADDIFRSVLEEEGLQGSAVVLLVNADDGRRCKAAEAIADMLRECSLEVTVHALSGTQYTSALANGSYDLHLGQTMLSPNMDLSAFFEKGGTLDFCGMNDSAIAALCKDALANSGNYVSLFEAVMDDAMLCPVAFLNYAIYVQSDLVDSFSPARDNIFSYSLGKTMSDALIP